MAIIALIATPLIMDVIDDVRINSFNIETSNVEKAAEHYLATELNLGDIPKYKEYYIPVNSLTKYLKKTKNKMLDEYVIVKKTDYNINYYYTGRDKNPYLKNRTLKEAIESDSVHIKKNVKVNGVIVNKVVGTKTEKTTIKNRVWHSGQLWQVMETTDEYVKLITANSVTSIAYGPNSNWETSWVRKWLNEIDSESNQDGIFYNNLSRTDLLLDGRFCLDEPTGLQK